MVGTYEFTELWRSLIKTNLIDSNALIKGYQFADDDFDEPEVKEEEDEVLKVEVITNEVKEKEPERPLVISEAAKPVSKPISTIEPIYENDFYEDGEFAYDEYGNIVGRVAPAGRNALARERWHWAFTKIVQVSIFKSGADFVINKFWCGITYALLK